MTDIYQRVWESDENHFSVSLPTIPGSWEDPEADILLDKQVKASGRGSIDLATQPLFHKVNEEKFKLPTYASFIQLLDNYVANFREQEIVTVRELQEIQEFLDLILQTQPIQLARKHINQEFGETLSNEQFKAKLQRIWFELYTNYYQRNRPSHFASGFEHVFVGEAKFSANFRDSRDRTENLGEISGYHSWVKFYFDESRNRVNFLGYKYDLGGNEGSDNPNVVTLQMLWNLTDIRGNVIAQLFKKKGGFFVGTSPECEVAMGTVAYFESLYGRLSREDRRRTTINGANYDLVLYRNITPEGSRGKLIRSFYPELLRSDAQPEPEMNRPVIVPVEVRNDGPVAIMSALPNPEGPDEGQEWVELKNTTDETIDLTGWEMRDKATRPESLSGTLKPQEVKRFAITRSNSFSMQLGNNNSFISLHNEQSSLVAAVSYGFASSGEVIRFD